MTDTKTKLLRSAAKLFAKYGLDGVSTRDLAKRSGVNLCSINYYFGTKQKLYEAVLQDVISYISDHFLFSVRESIASAGQMTPRESALSDVFLSFYAVKTCLRFRSSF